MRVLPALPQACYDLPTGTFQEIQAQGLTLVFERDPRSVAYLRIDRMSLSGLSTGSERSSRVQSMKAGRRIGANRLDGDAIKKYFIASKPGSSGKNSCYEASRQNITVWTANTGGLLGRSGFSSERSGEGRMMGKCPKTSLFDMRERILWQIKPKILLIYGSLNAIRVRNEISTYTQPSCVLKAAEEAAGGGEASSSSGGPAAAEEAQWAAEELAAARQKSPHRGREQLRLLAPDMRIHETTSLSVSQSTAFRFDPQSPETNLFTFSIRHSMPVRIRLLEWPSHYIMRHTLARSDSTNAGDDGFYDMCETFNLGCVEDLVRHYATFSLRDTNVEALHLAVDNMVTLRLSGIEEGEDLHFWVHILESSSRLEHMILSRLCYPSDGTTEGWPEIPIRTRLHSLVIGGWEREMILSLHDRGAKSARSGLLGSLSTGLQWIPGHSSLADQLTPHILSQFRASPLIQDLMIRANCSVAIKVLNALRSPHNKEALVLPGISFYLIVSDARNSTGLTISTTAMKHFVDELERFLILRSKAQWDDVESGRWQQKDSPKVVECLKLESSLYNENDCYKDYVQDFDCLTDEDGEPPYQFHELDERRSDAHDAEITWNHWDELVYPSEDEYMAD
ncbi:hypothetical protein BS47DRAFT_1389852 [Hydnum rufescens UP504]|uniref:Uncharacterized protein n=1 Tax=Hydnum rufescens UP504 TaxID=1448309 RepID=A0A9P6B4V3_9AGAM|nr:hypothetical protein BS47DRAFT_1389852 [Hydnum rufescens UP504]